MTGTLEASHAWSRGVARRRARNFYYSFLLLPKAKRDAICAVYAFMRQCDDLSDEPGAGRPALDGWRAELENALAGRYGESPVWPGLHDAVTRYGIPPEYLREMIDGVASDLDFRPMRDFDELYRYCYRVASVVGMTVVHIFGYEAPEALVLAEKCGIAFQLTNILRDVREDADRGRIYLPLDDLERFHVRAAEIEAGTTTAQFRDLLRFEAARARSYYDESKPLLELIDPTSRASLWALREIYQRLLERIERSDFDVLRRRIRVPGWEKSWIALRAGAGMLS
jgi:phytoene synthase